MVIWVSLALTSPEILKTLQHCRAGLVHYSGFTSGLRTDSFTSNISFVGILLLNYQTKSSALPAELMAHILSGILVFYLPAPVGVEPIGLQN